MSELQVRRLSDALSSPILRAYKAGGYGLVLVFTGTVLILTTLFFGDGFAKFLVAAIGTSMIVLVLVLFYLQDIKKLKDANDSIQDNRELIDTVQETAIVMTELAYNLQSLAFKHADAANLLITTVREKLREVSSLPGASRIPVVDKMLKFAHNKHLVKTEELSASIVNTAERARTVIDEIRTALVKSDPSILKKYLKEVRDLDDKAKAFLAAEAK